MRASHCWWAPAYDLVTGPLERGVLAGWRERLLGDLGGVVLDVGAGTGANLRYLQGATQVIAVEPDRAMRRQLTAKVPLAPCPVSVVDGVAESLPCADASVDEVVFTSVLCTVRDVGRALSEAGRVLRPGGSVVVLEHVRGTGRLAIWQDRLTPVWMLLNGGCHPNRDIETALTGAGFTITGAERFDPFPTPIPARQWLAATARR
jgi:ubiquinone/menaquinone biosynthesis C-methylase UbiE